MMQIIRHIEQCRQLLRLRYEDFYLQRHIRITTLQ
jgi:hypothetical protein